MALRNAFGDLASDESVKKLHASQLDGSQKTRVIPANTGGLSVYRNINLNAHSVTIKSSAGQVYGWFFFNHASSIRHIKLYNMSTRPWVGHDAPFMTIPLPAGGGANVSFTSGITFRHGIGIAATVGVADNDNRMPGLREVTANVIYY